MRDLVELVRPSPTQWYFGYSPLLSPQAQAEAALRLPEGEVAEAVDVDLIFDRPSRAWGGRVAGLVHRPGQSVQGRLFAVPLEHWELLQRAEGLSAGECMERRVQVRTAEGRRVEAVAFTTHPQHASQQGPVSERYAQALARTAEAAGLPSRWVQRLQAEALLLERVQGFGRRMGLI